MELLEVLNRAYDLARDAGDEDLAHAIDGFSQLVKRARDERNMISPAYKADRTETDTALLFDSAPVFFERYQEFQGVSFEVKRV